MSNNLKTNNGFYISKGNTKVKFLIVNVGAAQDCSSKKWCPFDKENKEQSGKKLCYAQKMERIYPNVLKARRLNEEIIKNDNGFLVFEVFVIITKAVKKGAAPIVRLNESGDLSKDNIKFCVTLAQLLSAEGIKVYLYSKAPFSLREQMINAGATVLHSERDFIAFANEEELKKSGMVACPGICGVGHCTRCPDGLKSGILEH